MSKIYISLADSRAKGFMKWSDAHPERLGEARTVSGEGAVIAAPDLAQGRTAASSVARARHRYALKDATGQVSTRDTILAAAKSAAGLVEPGLLGSGQGRAAHFSYSPGGVE